ncbi:MAG: HAMP domain-containing histidine kinase [Ignavibacteriae bacterium]|nr:MAG: HAMP domain-containing histidine kinase [Ignavibacteriota bacterium]
MIRPQFYWKLLYPYLILLIFSLIVFGFFFVSTIQNYYIDRTLEFQIQTTLAVKEDLNYPVLDTTNLQERLKRMDKIAGLRITVITPAGLVIGDSRENPFSMDTHNDRPEIEAALKGDTGHSIRYSHTLRTDMIYAAVPLYDSQNNVRAILRTSIPLNIVYFHFSNIYPIVIAGGILIIIIASFIGMFISRRLGIPLLEMRNAAKRFSMGNFKQKIFPPKDRELKSLADSLNSMAVQLDEKISIISEQKNLQQAVLESMKEGVIAVDYDERILLINKTAEQILLLNEGKNKGKTLQEAVRVSEIQKFFKKVINEGTSQEEDVIIQFGLDKTLQLSGTVLFDSDNYKIGVLVVLNDISNLKYLDTLKRDLVANVSHELKTPITTIKGFIETLREGAIDNPLKSERFLDIIYKNTERLNAIVEDLLSLSRIEQSSSTKELKFNEQKICSILETAYEDYKHKAGEKNINIKINCDCELTGNVNKLLIEQAIGNLVDNAIKYSDKNKEITVEAIEENGSLILNVHDEGYGISKEHFPRLFERFYRIDKSRSREVGGTGLGLAIVKHIAQVHGGTVEVSSTPGTGSVFTIKIPA